MRIKLRLSLFIPTILLLKGDIFASPKDSIHRNTSNPWTFHFQFTSIDQYHGYFNSPYTGHYSLKDTMEQDASLSATLFLGRRLWKYAAGYFDAETSDGQGFSGTDGIAAFPNAEIYRVGVPFTLPYIARCYFQQSIALPGSHDTLITEDVNQVTQYLPAKRITFSVGKFSLADFYDNNPYSHDPRSQFMNWVLMDNGAWDYPADTRGYTYSALVQLIEPTWYTEISDALEPLLANGPNLDWSVSKTFGITWESGFTYKIKDKTGGLSLLLYMNQNRGGNYENAITAYNETHNPEALDVDSISAYNGNKKYGFGLSWNQQVSKYIGLFARLGWDNGQNATWAFTDVDQTFTPGVSINGQLWHRKNDSYGASLIVDGISKEHIAFLNAGGYCFIIGDGKLPNYAPEEVFETYYQAKLFEQLYLAVDYQFVQNPAYNADRGPVSIFSARVHVEF